MPRTTYEGMPNCEIRQGRTRTQLEEGDTIAVVTEGGYVDIILRRDGWGPLLFAIGDSTQDHFRLHGAMKVSANMLVILISHFFGLAPRLLRREEDSEIYVLTDASR